MRPPDILISRTGHPTSTPSFSYSRAGRNAAGLALRTPVVACGAMLWFAYGGGGYVWAACVVAPRSPRRCPPYPPPIRKPQHAALARWWAEVARQACPFEGAPSPFPLRGECPSLRGGGRRQGLVALPCGRHQVPDTGTVACPALLQATARRCRSAGDTTGQGEQLCCQPFFPLGGAGHLRFNAKVARGGVKERLEAGGCYPLKPLPSFMPPGGGTNVPPLAALQLEGVAGSRRRRGGEGTRRNLAVATGGLACNQGAGGD